MLDQPVNKEEKDESRNRRILIVDDNESIHEDFRKILESGGDDHELDEMKALFLQDDSARVNQAETFEIHSAFQGEQGLEMVRKSSESGNPYAMAFVDMRMPPGWDGLATIEQIWKEYPELQVVICTAYSDHSWDEIVQRLGYSDQLLILKKPFDNVEVRQLVYALTEKWYLSRQARVKMEELFTMVNRRTEDLEAARNELLQMNQRLSTAKQAAERANKTKSEFIASMSHEIRTPITAILGYTELLRDEDEATIEAIERRDILDTILRNGQHLLNVINDILDLSKIEAGKLDVERVECSTLSIISNVMALMHVRAGQKGLSLTSEIDGAIPRNVHTDPTRLQQILINLIANAIKFSDQGCVRVRTSLLRDDPTKPMLQFDVIDSGVGMTREQAAKIFEPFTQGDISTARLHGGSGLGLAICKRLSRMLGGDVQIVETAPGKGSTFRATIEAGPLDPSDLTDPSVPTTVCEADSVPQVAAEVLPRINGSVLVAEDGDDNRRLLAFWLQKAGAMVTVANNGQDAVEQVESMAQQGTPFDLILMDMQMPLVDGYEAVRRLRADGYDLPIVSLTVHTMTGDRERCLEAGCNEYLAKPIDRATLLKTVDRLMPPVLSSNP